MPSFHPEMSRVCVKNLPAYVTEARLRETFQSKGTVTDVKILKTKGGQSRHMAFVGFKDEASATAAVKFFNKSFMDTARLSVEIARSIKEDAETGGTKRGIPVAKPKLAPVPTAGGSEAVAPSKKRKAEVLAPPAPEVKPVKDDTRLKEFLALMKSRNATSTWSNDDNRGGTKNKAVKPTKATKPVDDEGWTSSSDGSDSDEYQELLTRPNGGAGQDSDTDEPLTDEDDEEEDEEKAEPVAKPADKKNVGTKEDRAASKKAKFSRDDGEVEDVGESGRLFVRNLPYSATEADISNAFSRFGTLSSCHLAVDEAKQSKGFA